ncbi:MAG: hypothetical protein AAF447_25505 [Myxococcota bacterium]
MTTVLLALAFVLLLALLVADAVGVREQEERPASPPGLVPRGPRWPLQLVAGITGLFGLLAFPLTLAPVVLTVLTAQAHPLTGDGGTSLAAILVAALCMSAAVKSFRFAGLLMAPPPVDTGALWRLASWLGGWNALVMVLFALARPTEGPVQLLLALFIGASLTVFALGLGATRFAEARTRPASKPLR